MARASGLPLEADRIPYMTDQERARQSRLRPVGSPLPNVSASREPATSLSGLGLRRPLLVAAKNASTVVLMTTDFPN